MTLSTSLPRLTRMRKYVGRAAVLRVLAAACVLGAPLTLVGCDENASAHASPLDRALAEIEQAQSGYAPFAGEGKPPLDYQQHRQQALAKSAPTLETAIREGSPAQRATARRLMADLRASAARNQARGALEAAAGLTSRAAVTASQLVALDHADARASSLAVDTTAARNLLEDDLTKTRDQLAALDKTLAEKKQTVAAADQSIADLRARAKTTLSQAQAQQAKTFDMEGVARFDAMDKAAQAEREGNRLLYQAQAQQAQRDEVASQANVLQAQVDALTQQAKAVTQSLADLANQDQQDRKLSDAARADQAAVAAALAQELTAISQGYDQAVFAPLDKALQTADDALAQLDAATADATGPAAQNLQLDKLNKQLYKLAILADHVSVLADYTRSLSILTTRAKALLPAEQAQQLIGYRAAALNRQKALIAAATEVLGRAAEILTPLLTAEADNQALTATLTKQQQSLSTYRQQLQADRAE